MTKRTRIDEHTLGVLEFPAVLGLLAGYAASDLGRREALALQPTVDMQWIRRRIAETTELRGILERHIRVPLSGLKDVTDVLARSGGGVALEPEELLDICDTLLASETLKRFFLELRFDTPQLRRLVGKLGQFEEVTGEIERCIDGEGTVRAEASERLGELRRCIDRLQGQIRERFRRITGSPTLREALENDNLLIRNNRPVIAVKTNYRSWVPGLVIDRSSSGATLYVEPQGLGELSNELEEAVYEERKEVGRILWELTRLVSQRRDEIGRTVRVLGWLDLAYAKAKFSIAQGMSPGRVEGGQVLCLHNARHPLLVEMAARKQEVQVSSERHVQSDERHVEGDAQHVQNDERCVEGGGRHVQGNDQRVRDGRSEVVPTGMTLGEEFDILLLTGPNTGGKTVTLKTVGLAVLMCQSGMHVPTEDGSVLPVFEQVHVDIGDEQSLQQSLSTFSAHMARIVGILDRANDASLVLLDELGAGTDPAEGAALAQAILERLKHTKAKVVATTHLGSLKSFAYRTERVRNASVEFDADTLRPTYRLLVGAPGSSNAMAITERLGMPHSITARAEQLLGEESVIGQELINQAQSLRSAAEQQNREAAMLRDEAVKLHEQARQIRSEAQQEQLEAWSEADTEIDRTMGSVNKLLLGFLGEMGNAPKPWRENVEVFANELRGLAARTTLAQRRAEFVKKVRLGDYVYLRKLHCKALVLRIQRKRKRMTVAVEDKQIEVPFAHVSEPPV